MTNDGLVEGSIYNQIKKALSLAKGTAQIIQI